MAAPLPPNWAAYTTAEGKEYFHNAVKNTTQWERPAPEPTGMSDVFQYNPSATELEVGGQQRPLGESALLEMQTPVSVPIGATPLGNSGLSLDGKEVERSAESEMVSLMKSQAPPGQLSASTASAAPAGSAPAGGGLGSLVGGAIVSGAMAAAGGGASSNEGAPGIGARILTSAQELFDVSTADVVKRLRLVLVPYPPAEPGGAADDLKARPDFYGPFWVATTAVLFLAATGNFAQLVEAGTHAGFKANYGLLVVAASMIYGCLVGVALVARVSLFASGEDVGCVDFRQMICVCGYALAPAIPVSILCIVPLNGLRWLVTLLGLAASLFFLRGQLWADFLAVKTPWLKWLLLVVPGAAQVIVYGVYRLHFFTRPK